MEWEHSVEQATVLERVADDTLVFLQLHKRVWPAAQRDALFWSHMRYVCCYNLQAFHAKFSDSSNLNSKPKAALFPHKTR